MDGTLTIEDGSPLRLSSTCSCRNDAALRNALPCGSACAMAAPGAPAASVQPGAARAPQRRPSLRSVGPALRALPRPRPAIFLRLFPLAGRRPRDGAGQQEAPHRGQAAAASRAAGARHRLGLGRARRSICARDPAPTSPGVTLSEEQHKVAQRARRGRRPRRPRPLPAARLPRGDRAVTTASSRSACSSMSACSQYRDVLPQAARAAAPTTASPCCTRSAAWTGRAPPIRGCANTSSPAAIRRRCPRCCRRSSGRGLWVTDIEILRLHYAETLRAWREPLRSRTATASAPSTTSASAACGSSTWSAARSPSAATATWSSRCSSPSGRRGAADPRLHGRLGTRPQPRRRESADRRAPESEILHPARTRQSRAIAGTYRGIVPAFAQAVDRLRVRGRTGARPVIWLGAHGKHHDSRVTPLREPDLERVPQPPANTEAEQALLGAILDQQPALRPGRRVPAAGAFRRPGARPHLRRDRQADRARPDRQPGHAEEPVRPGRRARRDRRRAIPGAARRIGRHDHQRRALRPHDPRPAPAPPADHDRRGRRQRGLPARSRRPARRADRARRSETVRAGVDRPGRGRLPRRSRRR